jgi:cation transport ATPase
MVEEATASHPSTQRFIEKFSVYRTPGAMAVDTSKSAVHVMPRSWAADLSRGG